MQNMGWKLALIVVLVGLCLAAVLTREVRLGKDLQGGVSLVYHVSVPDGADSDEVLNQIITVLKDRVNPQGNLDISMAPLGRDRIEIVMPLPNEEVNALRKAYTAVLERLKAESAISEVALDQAIEAGDIEAAFPADPTTQRGKALLTLQGTINDVARLTRDYETAQEEGADSTTLNRLAQDLADAQVALDDARAAVLELNLDSARVLRVLRLPTERGRQLDPVTNLPVIDPETGKEKKGDSQREVALKRLKQEFPDLAGRLDELVTAFDAYQTQKQGFDDPEDLKRLLRGSGVLEFRIAVRANQPDGVPIQDLKEQLRERGPNGTDTNLARWFVLNDLKQWYDNPAQLQAIELDPGSFFAQRNLVVEELDGQYYMLLWNTQLKRLIHEQGDVKWAIQRAGPTVDQLGRPAVSFTLDDNGGARMGRLTGAHLQQPMAIVLDDQVYSAPNINSQINRNGIIQGDFTEAELGYLIRVLAAGSLEARLSPEPISQITVGPSLGRDNLERGKEAFIIALAAVAVFMVFYYFLAGIVSAVGLAINGVIIFGLMMAWDATFTLPGMAGIVLTIGMAVDANVLIYERIREELFAGEYDLRGAIREGYRKALSTILDGNITNLIVCAVLYRTATTEVRGFAVTLAIGICGTLFTTLFVTRQVYYFYTDVLKAQSLPMLATRFPAIHRLLEPTIHWINMRKFFWGVSILAAISSVVLVLGQGVEMFDTEFRGGVQATMLTRVDEDAAPPAPDPQEVDAGAADESEELPRVQLSLDDIRARLTALGEAAGDPDAATDREERIRLAVMRELGNASVVTIGDVRPGAAGGITASEFQIKVSNPGGLALEDEGAAAEAVVSLLVDEFSDVLEVSPARTFTGSEGGQAIDFTRQIDSPDLGDVLADASVSEIVRDEMGGVAVIIDAIEPPISLQEITQRIDSMRQQPDFLNAPQLTTRVIGIEQVDATATYGSVVVVATGGVNYRDDDMDVVDEQLATPAWELVSAALRRQSSLKQVSSYSSSVAHTLSANATVAVVLSLLGILLYIWIRFGSLRYSVAAVVALVHDVTIALGLLALTAFIGDTSIGAALRIEHFRIDLGVVAALLTIIGYSLNDTIVILDRIRENRGKLPLPTADIVNNSINQTISRTLLTSSTTLLAVVIMYAAGGMGIRPFTFCLMIGILVGTYSSVGVAAPLVFRGGGGPSPEPAPARPGAPQPDKDLEGVATA